jgi:hypothetical protein
MAGSNKSVRAVHPKSEQLLQRRKQQRQKKEGGINLFPVSYFYRKSSLTDKQIFLRRSSHFGNSLRTKWPMYL